MVSLMFHSAPRCSGIARTCLHNCVAVWLCALLCVSFAVHGDPGEQLEERHFRGPLISLLRAHAALNQWCWTSVE